MFKMETKAKQESKDFKYFVRVANTDLEGKKPIFNALTKIRGVGKMFANTVCSLANIEKTKKAGSLSEEEVKKIDEVVKDPLKFKTPSWMLNRRNDPEEGKDKHIITSDLIFAQENDLKIMKKIKCYKGVRHSMGLTVRGQRTKSNFRKNKGKVSLGVKKKGTAKSGRV